ncbi:hemicentin-1-like isoform X2 [Mercenaria mercenaria]|uniref:hemicentin-1-like isoform X2 n=1 Tax=Mercenaria mercenaria TaxID=6596 RepID=UPI00234E46CB|nr:hemicentin-1-like isoform X2 [Mercenaria mercenaria]
MEVKHSIVTSAAHRTNVTETYVNIQARHLAPMMKLLIVLDGTLYSVSARISTKQSFFCPKYCNLCHIVDGNWSPWSSWSLCDVTCGNGTESRVRYCTDPPPQYGGLDCPGEGTDLKTCKRQLCPVHGGWSDWGPWGTCPETCGIGMMSRTRSCTNPVPERFGDHCFGNSLENALCRSEPCAIQGDWGGWAQWGECSVTCGIGMQARARSCNNPTQEGYGNICSGRDLDVKLCYPGLCGNTWSEWQSWSTCSVDCEGGVRTRSRWCFNPTTFKSEGDCSGSSTETESCGNTGCITDCYDVLKKQNATKSGVYNITLWRSKQNTQVYCDMETDNGGWTVFQYRCNGAVDFYRNFTEYERGFGDFRTEFWLGLIIVQEMAAQGKNELRLDLSAADGSNVFETFQNFVLGPGPNYTLNFDRGIGTARYTKLNNK